MNFEHFAVLLLNAKQHEPSLSIRTIITELLELDEEQDSGFARFEQANLTNLPLVKVYETALETLGVVADVTHAAWFTLFLIAEGKHRRIVMYLTLIAYLAKRNYGRVNARVFLQAFNIGIPSFVFVDTLYELSLAPDGSCKLLESKWETT